VGGGGGWGGWVGVCGVCCLGWWDVGRGVVCVGAWWGGGEQKKGVGVRRRAGALGVVTVEEKGLKLKPDNTRGRGRKKEKKRGGPKPERRLE